LAEPILERSWQHLLEKKEDLLHFMKYRKVSYKHRLAKKGFPRKSPWHFIQKKKNALTFICKKGYSIFRRKKVTCPPNVFPWEGKTLLQHLSLNKCFLRILSISQESCQCSKYSVTAKRTWIIVLCE
jgi:hypothetical protein